MSRTETTSRFHPQLEWDPSIESAEFLFYKSLFSWLKDAAENQSAVQAASASFFPAVFQLFFFSFKKTSGGRANTAVPIIMIAM